ncbi:PREDICTED: uncharacterized protein LOC109337211 [Lupinus angustifolius]|uniref:uncharacterized protein LOC109337211 n=1 Tax=Lupinus angustifolius TaxID=3871 RepID=UPI00092E2A9B|nr:PREDICTED: uncharacterized protein LOC109337211 [Lupinus angustifolius]
MEPIPSAFPINTIAAIPSPAPPYITTPSPPIPVRRSNRSSHPPSYKQSQHDHSLFTKSYVPHFTALLIYVDDLILAGNDPSEIQSVKIHLDTEFKIKDLGQLKYFFGLEVARTKHGISLCQKKYALDLIKDTDFLTSKHVCTLMVKTTYLQENDNDPYHDHALYRQLVGILLYLTDTRLHLNFTIEQLSQFMAGLSIKHHKAMTCIQDVPSLLIACLLVISWKSKKQNTISRSSSEAKYRALAIL